MPCLLYAAYSFHKALLETEDALREVMPCLLYAAYSFHVALPRDRRCIEGGLPAWDDGNAIFSHDNVDICCIVVFLSPCLLLALCSQQLLRHCFLHHTFVFNGNTWIRQLWGWYALLTS